VKRALVALAVLTLISPTFANAEHTFRCEGQMIQHGDSKAKMIDRCGEPIFVDRIILNSSVIDQYTYSYSRNLYVTVSIVGNRIISVKTSHK